MKVCSKISRLLRFVLLASVLVLSASSYAFTTGTASWLGVRLIEPNSSLVQPIKNDLGQFSYLTAVYSREANLNLYSPTWISGGFSVFRTFADLLPGQSKYSQFGATLDMSARLLAFRFLNQKHESVLGFGAGVGLSMESVYKLVGSSKDIEDFGKVDFIHYNRLSLLNGLATFNLFVQLPLEMIGINEAFYSLSYFISVALYGPFLPNFEVVQVGSQFSRAQNALIHTIGLRVKF